MLFSRCRQGINYTMKYTRDYTVFAFFMVSKEEEEKKLISKNFRYNTESTRLVFPIFQKVYTTISTLLYEMSICQCLDYLLRTNCLKQQTCYVDGHGNS